jgi:hypothetical protein
MLLFRSEEHVLRWCGQWNLARGATMPIDVAWRLAFEWYKDRLKPDWRRRTRDEAQALFQQLGLTSQFWELPG